MDTDRTAQTWDELDARPTPTWYSDAKFGIFIHWGVFSVPAWRTVNDELFGSYAEWYYASVYGDYRNLDGDFHARNYGEETSYRDLARLFRAELFEPTEWARIFAASGARYVVLTAKHHDGFCLWPTANPHKKDWNSGDIGPERDLLGEIAEAVRGVGLRMGLYYSIPEWETHRSHRVDGGYFIPEADAREYGMDPDAYPSEVLWPQWKELNEAYRPSVIFTDGGEWDFPEEYTRTREMLSWLYSESPAGDEVVVNDRIHRGMPGTHGDIFSTEYEDVDGFGTSHAWEESRGIGKSYGYNRAETLDDYLAAEEIVRLLVRTVAGGGNLLLNVGPTADGRIPLLQQERLRQVGTWLEIFGEGIYATRPDEILAAEDQGVHLTRSERAHYVFYEAAAPQTLRLRGQSSRGVEPEALFAVEVRSGASVPVDRDDGTGELLLQVPATSAMGCIRLMSAIS